MVKVLFDYQHFSEQRYGGISRYFAGLMHGLESVSDVNCDLSALYSQNYYIKDRQLPLQSKTGSALFANKLKREIRWNKAYSRFVVHRGNYDVFHPTYYHPYFLDHIKKPFVITIHDMIHERFADSFLPNDPVKNYKKEVISRADKIIAISLSTKKDLIDTLNISDSKIKVIQHGVRLSDATTVKPNLTLAIPSQFILYVGDRNQYKNFNRFAEALAHILPNHKNLYLICTGGFPFSDAEVDLLHNLNIIHRCIRLNVTDDELNQLYRHAQLLVVPSLCEGFGYPILEAFNAGCPVAASRIPAIVETAGDAAIYFNPYNVEEMVAAMGQLLQDTELRNELTTKGRQRVKMFDLQREVEETIAVYKELAL